MTRYIIITVTALLLVNCNNQLVTNGNSKQLINSTKSLSNQLIKSTKSVNELPMVTKIPLDCQNELGQLDTNKGHDSLDCDNL